MYVGIFKIHTYFLIKAFATSQKTTLSKVQIHSFDTGSDICGEPRQLEDILVEYAYKHDPPSSIALWDACYTFVVDIYVCAYRTCILLHTYLMFSYFTSVFTILDLNKS